MGRVLRLGNFGVYVGDERGACHHGQHAHVKDRGRRIASVHLVTLETLAESEPIPRDVMDLIRDNQELLLQEWEALNS